MIFVLMVAGCSGGAATSIVGDVTLDAAWPEDVSPEVGGDGVVDLRMSEAVPDFGHGETGAEIDAGWEPGPGEAGYPCKSDSECLSEFCIPTGDGDKCTAVCQDECPFGWECALHQASLPDEVFICVPPDLVLCKPCNLNTDCLSGGADVGGRCISYGGAGSFCATPCDEENLCSLPYKCLEGTDATGADVNACVLDLPECQCTQDFADEGAWTACFVENELGACEGERQCTADGLSECDASVPAGETCNGIDDDCDGDVDEGTSGEPCSKGNDLGECPGETVCVGGVPMCDANEPEPEECDGKDNNCDGQVDEGYPDTDEDGTADCMETDKDGDGVADGKDNCELTFNPGQDDFDLDGKGDECDLDDDNDLSADADDCNPFDNTVHPGAEEKCDGKDNDCDLLLDEGFKDSDADGFKDCTDEDDDNDGFVDQVDCLPLDPFSFPGAPETCDGKDNDCDNQVDENFPDEDNDGTADCLDDDQDGDGVPNDQDNCPAKKNSGQEDADDDGIGDACDTDLDGDGVPNGLDNCAELFNPPQADQDEDGVGDACDDDLDGDGVDNGEDNCPEGDNPGQEDNDDDETGDACDDDDDNDGVADGADNCPLTPNPQQADTDKDGTGDACEDDVDGDKVPDGQDNCPSQFNPGQEDCDSDGQGDACQADDDGDGVVDDEDNCLCLENPDQGDQDGDEQGDACDKDRDGDGVANGLDNCPDTFNAGQGDLDGDQVGDACDDDTDGDGVLDGLDNCPLVSNPGQQDPDEDGAGNACDDDDDGDGDPDVDDCADLDALVHHGADEKCDGLDNNCSGSVDEGYPDFDADGVKNCVDDDDDADGDPDTSDCYPLNPAVYHGAPEVCNGMDDDCNGPSDDGLGSTTCGKGACQHTVPNCQDGQPVSCDPLEGAVAEVCDGKDNDCNGVVDEGLGQTTCGKGVCLHAVGNCAGGEVVQCDPLEGASDEVCDGLDNDCDGPADEELGSTTCGVGVCQHSVLNCINGEAQVCDPMAGAGDEVCDGKDNNCNEEVDEGLGETTCGKGECLHSVPYCTNGKVTVCDPFEGSQAESCDGLDNDCDGEVDDGLGATTCGLGVCLHSVPNCLDGQQQSCDPMEGSTDEKCDAQDNDCNGSIDEDLGFTTCGQGVCQHTVLNCVNGEAQVCDPMSGAGDEVCDGKDNNCQGDVDEDLGVITCGLGECQRVLDYCTDGEVTPCDPFEGAVAEVCDGLDNNCDGEADNGIADLTCGLGQCAHSVTACIDGVPQDCDPLEGAGPEICDGLDNDCDGVVDNSDKVCDGCNTGLCAMGDVRDGSTVEGTDLKYQYSPVTAGDGYVKANWDAVTGAVSYLVSVGTAPGASDVFAATDVGGVTSYTASGLTVAGAWTGAVYYVNVVPVGNQGAGDGGSSDGVSIAEAVSWDGVSVSVLNGGYNVNWPQSGVTSVYGKHYFETVAIAEGTVVNVQGWGKVDQVPESVSASAASVTEPKDGWLELYANSISVEGRITASGRGYGGGGGGGGGSASVSNRGHGGKNGLGGDGGNGEGNHAGGGGGGSPGGKGGYGGQGYGGNGNLFGGGSGSTACNGTKGRDGGDGPVSNVGKTGATAASGNPGVGGAGEFMKGGANGVPGCDNWTGGGGGGYGGGASGGTQWVGPGTDAAGGGGGGTGGVGGGHTPHGGAGAGPYGGSGGTANASAGGKGGYRAGSGNGDTTTDRTLYLGSGGGGGGTGYQETGGGGGGAGGGWIKLYAAESISISGTGQVMANGAGAGGGGRDNGGGSTSYTGGVGAGGGILLEGKTVTVASAVVDRISARGGSGATGNGGTIKLFYDVFSGAKPTAANSGRVYDAGAGSFE